MSIGDVERVYLMSTDMPHGKLCARVVESYLDELAGRDIAEVMTVVGFGTKDFQEALKNLTQKVKVIVEGDRRSEVLLNLTGGLRLR